MAPMIGIKNMKSESSRILSNLWELSFVFIAVGLFVPSSASFTSMKADMPSPVLREAATKVLSQLVARCSAIHKFARHPLLDKAISTAGMWVGGPLASIIEWLVSAGESHRAVAAGRSRVGPGRRGLPDQFARSE
jgi:hypothetical protein